MEKYEDESWGDNIERQLQCSAKTKGKHEMVYSKPTEFELTKTLNAMAELRTASAIYGTSMLYTPNPTDAFIFKCSTCGLEITKTKTELTAKEKTHLTGLGLLEVK